MTTPDQTPLPDEPTPDITPAAAAPVAHARRPLLMRLFGIKRRPGKRIKWGLTRWGMFLTLLVVVFSVWLRWLPGVGTGWKGPDTWVLPVIALSGYQIAQIARYTRASMLEVTRKDYVRTAQSKGIAQRAVVVRHMIRNALIPVVTILGPILAFLVTGSFVVEYFFGVPGIGQYYVKGIVQRDYGLIMAMTVLYAFAVAFLNVVVDVLYAYIDPRIRYN